MSRLTFLPNGHGTTRYGYINTYETAISTVNKYEFAVRDYVLKGFFPSGGGWFIDGDFRIFSQEAGYSDSSNRWINTNSNVSLYCYWESATTLSTYFYRDSYYQGAGYITIGSYGLAEWTAPTRSGYVFAGYKREDGTKLVNANGSFVGGVYGCTESSGKYYATTAPSKLIEIWTEAFRITYNIGSGTGTTPTDTNTYTSSSRFTVKYLEPQGHPPSGKYLQYWTYNGSAYYEGSTYNYPASSNITLYASYDYITHYVYYTNPEGLSGSPPSTGTVYDGNAFTVTTACTLSKTGYRLVGWQINASGTIYRNGDRISNVTSNLYLTPYWEEITYKISYWSEGSERWSETKYYNTTLKISDYLLTPPTGATFKGWDTSSAGKTVVYNVNDNAPNQNLTLYAVFAYGIVYYANGATSGSVPTDSNTYTYGANFTTKTNSGNLKRTGYSFNGWNTWSSGGGTHYDVNTTYPFNYSVTLSLNAEWTALSQYYCKYWKNDGSEAYTRPLMGYAGDTYSLISLPSEWARTGYTFKGWFLSGGSVVQPGYSFTISSDVEYYASWEANTHYIYYRGNGGSGYMERSTVTYGSSAFAKTNTFTYTGKQFVGWNTNADGSGTWYTPGVTFTYNIDDDLELFAQWGTLVTLTFDANNSISGTPPSSVSGLTGETTQIPGKNTLVGPTGTNFAGWNTLADGSGSSYSEGSTYTFGSADATLYAIWSANQYSVTVVQPEHGTITPSSGTYAHGTQVVYSVTPEDDYVVTEWSVTGTSTFDEDTLTLTVLSATTITCTLEYNPGPSVQVNVDTHGAVTVPQSVYTTIAGTPITVSATYQSGQSYDSIDIIQGTCTVASTTGSTFTITPQTNCTVRIRAKHPLPTPIVSNQINKYQIVVYNGTNMVILTRGIRKDDQNKIVWISDVNISSRLDGVGSGSFTLHTDANYTDSIVAIDSDILILEDGIPVYYGTITSVKRSENNFYGNHVFTGIQEYSIGFAEASRSLNYKPSSDGGVITTNPGGIVYNILGNDMTGDVDTSTSSTTFTISSQNKLSLLDKLGDQVGWRYRCRPYIISVENTTSGNFPRTGSSGTITGVSWRNLKSGDLIIVYDGSSTHVYRCNTTANSATSVSFTGAKHTSSASLVSPTVCRVRRFMIDFKPSFYQTNSVLVQDSTIPSSVTNRKAWGTNYSAMSNNDSDSDSVKYGSVSVSSPQGNGIVYSSTIPLIKKHNKDYSYSESTYVSYSYDSAISGWTWNATDRHLTFVIAGGSESKMYALFEESGALHLAMNYYPNNLVDKERGLYKYLNVCYDDENVDQTVGDAALIAITSEYPDPNTWVQIKVASGSQLEYYLNGNMVELDSISSTHYTLSSAGNLVSQPVTYDVSVQLGGEACVADIYQSGELVVTNRTYPDLDSDGSYYPAYQHRIGCIVMKGTIQSADSDSPYAKYPERTLCAEMQSGYPYIDVDYIASNYALFGSNFDSQGTCKVPLVKFAKVDNQKYNLKGLLNVGDHIAIYKSYSSGSDASKDYELLEYKVDLDKMMVDVKYGTKTIDLGSTLYNLRKNISTNITRF